MTGDDRPQPADVTAREPHGSDEANVFAVDLLPHHARLLADSAIAPEVASIRGYVSINGDNHALLAELGFGRAQRSTPGLLIPVHGVDGAVKVHQYRPDAPRLNARSKPIKYEIPYKARLALDVPPGARKSIGDPSVPLWITEGSRKADAAVSVGLCCIGLIGVWGWRGTNSNGGKCALPDWDSVALNGRDVFVGFDSDVMTKPEVEQALSRLTAFLEHRRAKVTPVYLPAGTGAKVGLDDYLASHSIDNLLTLARGPAAGRLDPIAANATPPPRPPRAYSLVETVATFRRWLHLEDPAPLYILAAALVANRAPGDPVWLLLVCAPSTGKTELLSAATTLPWVCPASTLTAASLLSGTSRKERAKDATGGLLRQIGDFGVILAKDFTSLLAQNKDTRAEVLAALREVYDGRWDRAVGTDGGKVLTWRGKCGLIGGVTPALDRYHAVVAALGDRFLLFRMPDADAKQAGRMALTHRGHEAEMRRELQDALVGLVANADITHINRALSEPEATELIRLASFTARGRTGVERDGYTRDFLYVPQVEGPGRLVTAYARLLGGLEAIGCDALTTWTVLSRVALDCMPAARAKFCSALLGVQATKTSDIAARVCMTTRNAREHLEDLALLGLASREKASNADNAPDLWTASPTLRQLWPESRPDKYPPTLTLSSREAATEIQLADRPLGPLVPFGSASTRPGAPHDEH